MTMTLLMTVTMMGVNRKSARTRENVDFYTIREREATLVVMNGERNTKDGHARARARERKNARPRRERERTWLAAMNGSGRPTQTCSAPTRGSLEVLVCALRHTKYSAPFSRSVLGFFGVTSSSGFLSHLVLFALSKKPEIVRCAVGDGLGSRVFAKRFLQLLERSHAVCMEWS